MDAVMAGWAAAGLDAIECLRNAVSVTKDSEPKEIQQIRFF